MGNPVAESASGFLVCAESSFSDLFRYILLVDRKHVIFVSQKIASITTSSTKEGRRFKQADCQGSEDEP